MSATKTFGEQLDALGIWWPRGDGDALREAAATWTAMAELLADITAVLDAAARSVVEHHHGDAANRFGELWQHWSSDSGYLATTVADCRRLAAALNGFGTDVDVADRTLAHLVEQALEAMASAIAPGAIDVWMTWLHDVTSGVSQDLSLRAAHHADPLENIQPTRQPRLPTDPGDVAIDPTRITWPDPGTPSDLTNLTTTVVDFGAGQGTLPPALTPPVNDPHPIVTGPATPVTNGPVDTAPPTIAQLPGAGAPATNIVVNGNGTTINVNVGAGTGVTPGVSVPAPIPALPPSPTVPDVVPPTTSAPSPYSAVGNDWTSGLNGIGTSDSSIPMPVEVPAISSPAPAVVAARPASVPISVDPPAVTTAAAAVAAVAATGAAAKVASGSAKPFLPFMPMGGGGASGDEGVEPKRRITRR